MGKISVIGHFGFGKNLLNGQTIKTKIITDELERIYGKENIVRYDTHGGAAFVLRMPFVILRMLIFSKNIVMMPGDKGLFMMMPLLWLLNPLFGRKILYVVIGGWLPGFLEKWRHLVAILSRIEGIFVETPTLKSQLQSLGLSNIYLMPNCKRTGISSSLSARHTVGHIPLCMFSRVMKEKGIEVVRNTPHEMIVNGNPTLIYGIFRNLVDNSIAYATGATRICIVGIEVEEGDRHSYEFTVSDNGQGVSPEHLPHLFERFYRVEKGRSRKLGGTGLGLAIVKNSVTAHGGTVTAELTPHGGLTIRFTLSS